MGNKFWFLSSPFSTIVTFKLHFNLLTLTHNISAVTAPSPLCPGGGHHQYMIQGLWVITGLLSFLLLEKMFPDQNNQEDPTQPSDHCLNPTVSFAAEIISHWQKWPPPDVQHMTSYPKVASKSIQSHSPFAHSLKYVRMT